MTRRDRRRHEECGQIIVMFALALVAIVAMVGLVLDGGGAFAQRRLQQNAADVASIAAANEFLISNNKATAQAVAVSVASENGFAPGSGTTVNVTFAANDTNVVVDITSPHRNNFASVVGMDSWDVSTTATTLVGIPDTAVGGPFIFNERVFADGTGVPLPKYSDPQHPFAFGDDNGPVPSGPDDIAWTCYGTCGNVDSSSVSAMVDGTSPVSVTLDPTVDFTEYTYIGQYNSGNHTSLYKDVGGYLVGEEVGVPVVDDNGMFQGWATFHVTGVDQGGKLLEGYFVSAYNTSDALTVTGCSGDCPRPRYFGTYVLKLIN